jgi:hypothetical protein
MAYKNIIFELSNPIDGIAVEVNARLAGNFEVILRDTDADEIVGIRMFPTENTAIEYAVLCC